MCFKTLILKKCLRNKSSVSNIYFRNHVLYNSKTGKLEVTKGEMFILKNVRGCRKNKTQ